MINIPDEIKKKLTRQQIDFIEQLQQYCNCEMQFYGSIERIDYFPQFSDIDIDVFTPNVNSTLFKLRQFLSTEEDKVQNVVWSTTKPTFSKFRCKKIKFQNDFIKLEIGVYDIKYKKKLIKVREYKKQIPFYALVFLYFVKFIYYNMNLLSYHQLARFKKFMMGDVLGMADDYNVIKST